MKSTCIKQVPVLSNQFLVSNKCLLNIGVTAISIFLIPTVIYLNQNSVSNNRNRDSFLLKSISDRYRLDRNPVGPITVRYKYKQSANGSHLGRTVCITSNVSVALMKGKSPGNTLRYKLHTYRYT